MGEGSMKERDRNRIEMELARAMENGSQLRTRALSLRADLCGYIEPPAEAEGGKDVGGLLSQTIAGLNRVNRFLEAALEHLRAIDLEVGSGPRAEPAPPQMERRLR